MSRGKRLTRDDWTAVALEALREGGLTAVAVEPLAARLGATKGSFYWHFTDREALVAATLARWEHDETDAVIAALAVAPDPTRRLELLAERVFAPDHGRDLDIVLLADAEHPLVAASLERVTQRRVDYLVEQFGMLGFDADSARARALLAYTAFLGMAQVRRHLPALAPAGPEMLRHTALLQRLVDPAPVDAPRAGPAPRSAGAVETP